MHATFRLRQRFKYTTPQLGISRTHSVKSRVGYLDVVGYMGFPMLSRSLGPHSPSPQVTVFDYE